MATNILTELDQQLASLNQLKPPGASKGKIGSITALCVTNIQVSSRANTTITTYTPQTDTCMYIHVYMPTHLHTYMRGYTPLTYTNPTAYTHICTYIYRQLYTHPQTHTHPNTFPYIPTSPHMSELPLSASTTKSEHSLTPLPLG